MTIATIKEYVFSVDTSTDIYNGNSASYTTLLPGRIHNVWGMQLLDISIPGVSNSSYLFLSVQHFNQISSPSGGMNIAFAKIPLNGTGNLNYIDSNGANFAYTRLDNPIATLDRLIVDIKNGQGQVINQYGNNHTFQIKLVTGALSPYGGGSTIQHNGRVLGGTF